jgi:hypothetical protein
MQKVTPHRDQRILVASSRRSSSRRILRDRRESSRDAVGDQPESFPVGVLGRFTSSVSRPHPWATVVSDALMSEWLGDALAGEIDGPSAEELLSEVSDDAMRTRSEFYALRPFVTSIRARSRR